MERWTGTPEGTRNESCGRFGKRTPFLRGRVQLLGCEPELNFTGRKTEHKNQHTSLQLVCCSFLLSYRIAERAIRATV